MVYVYKQGSIKKQRTLDLYSNAQQYTGPARQSERLLFSKERAKYLDAIDVGIRSSRTNHGTYPGWGTFRRREGAKAQVSNTSI